MKYIYSLIALMFAVQLSAQYPYQYDKKQGQDYEVKHAAIVAPNIPNKVVFCGDTIVLDRYDLRERLDRELINFCYMQASTTLIIKRANRLFPEVEPILKANNIPDDFKYLMTIESNLLPTAKSGVGAAGLWQFMEATAREYGLVVNSTVDERYNTEKATKAACKYLKDAKKVCGDWVSAAASYNAGQGRISGSLRNQGEQSALDLFLNAETSRYMFRIMAIKIIMENPRTYGFHIKSSQLYPAFEYDNYEVNESIADLVEWAKKHNTSYAILKESNLWLRGTKMDNKEHRTYIIRIPKKESLYYKPTRTKAHYSKWVVK